ncbi:MAG: polyprenyl synthetase family protein [Candidatus Omnitrophica bacterium]|nr:polyprenyl synthetase family protein [Candidatus Omnitrophota bacterium]
MADKIKFRKIKKDIEKALALYVGKLDAAHYLKEISPVLSSSIKNFLARKGKRVRPILFVIGYLGYAGKKKRGLYESAVAFELLHDFMLIHDDIIDKSDLRRGLPSMHRLLEKRIPISKKAKFSGSDLAIVAGDIVYAMAVDAFLSIDEDPRRKEKALKRFAESVLFTGGGEFIELLGGLKDIKKVTKDDIYKIYDLKTANYTFSSPLSIGALLAGAPKAEIHNLFTYGTYLGRAFQIKDDILDMFGDEKKTGKPQLTDLKESKKTILLWRAYHSSSPSDRKAIRDVLASENPAKKELMRIRAIVSSSGALQYAKKEVSCFLRKAERSSASLTMRPRYRKLLDSYCKDLLNI